MHCIRTHKRYCQSRETEPKQRFQARGERITLTLIERIEKRIQVTTTDVKKKKNPATRHCAQQEAHFYTPGIRYSTSANRHTQLVCNSHYGE